MREFQIRWYFGDKGSIYQIRASLAQVAELRRSDEVNKKTQHECASFLFWNCTNMQNCINSLLIVQRHNFYEKELSESSDERYLYLVGDHL